MDEIQLTLLMKDNQNQFNAQQQHPQTDSSQPVETVEDKEVVPSLSQGWYSHREQGFNGSVYLSILVEERSHLLLRLLGYGLLLFALVDYIDIIIPPHFTNPSWEFQTIGALVEHAAIPLMGLTFIFYRHEGYMVNLEKKLLGLLSWVSLLMGLLYLLALPLGIADTWRIYNSVNAQVEAQLSQQSQQLQQIKGQMNQATTDEQINRLLASLVPQARSQEIKHPQASKAQFLAQISQAEKNIKIQADSARTNQGQVLIKNSVKWHIGALIAGVLFIWIWYFADWTRIS